MKYHYSYCFLTYLIKWNVYHLLSHYTDIFIYFMVFCFDASFSLKVPRVCYIRQTGYKEVKKYHFKIGLINII